MILIYSICTSNEGDGEFRSWCCCNSAIFVVSVGFHRLLAMSKARSSACRLLRGRPLQTSLYQLATINATNRLAASSYISQEYSKRPTPLSITQYLCHPNNRKHNYPTASMRTPGQCCPLRGRRSGGNNFHNN
jgi:hypothetical protein